MNKTDEMQEIIQDFVIESGELLDKLDQDFVKLETAPDDLELLNQIFRSIHTIKGTCSFLGFNQMEHLTHEMESILNKLRKGEMKTNSGMMDVLLESLDIVKVLLDNIRNDVHEEVEISGMVGRLKELIEGEGKATEGHEEAKISEETPKIDNKAASDKNLQGAFDKQQRTKERSEQTIRMDVSRLDSLMNLVGEMVLSRNRLVQIKRRFEEEHKAEEITDDLGKTATQIDFVTSELQLAVMKMRMLPVRRVFSKFPRLVRDLARDQGKEVDLVISGEETEIDKSVIEEIGDPLIHLIRNAVDHGLESSKERQEKGKPVKGKVKLSAYHEGNHIIISVEDDGKGMNAEFIRNKAVEKGIIDAGKAERLSKRESLNLIFAPGFSTAKVVTNVSGRGVGMDVVKTNVEKLNGLIDMETELGKGSKIILKIPLTLASIQALLVEVGKDVFAIPLVSVVETARVSSDEIYTIDGCEVIRLHDSILSIVRLNEVFNVKDREEKKKHLYVVVVGLAEKRLGFVVGSLMGREEVVIKSIGDYLGDIPGVAGATIMGDGHVAIILDVSALVKSVTERGE